MPTYDYRCQACGHELEHFQAMTAAPLVDCPGCDAPELERLIGAGAGLIFKGSGYYQTDYRSEAYRQDAKADKEAGSKAPGDKTVDKTGDKTVDKTGDSSKADKPGGSTTGKAADKSSGGDSARPKSSES
ncbi:MAG: FmdB family transcriptional regulator [Planctomycetes bacterium]|nr:FmdB family transcriptional regulator [Planctomycetota bacterium]